MVASIAQSFEFTGFFSVKIPAIGFDSGKQLERPRYIGGEKRRKS
jgi:hypothetical protein